LERTGARVSCANQAGGGAEVLVEWRRAALAGAEAHTRLREAEA